MRKIREVLRRDALAEAREHPRRQLVAWLGFHGWEMQDLAEHLVISTGSLSLVLAGKRTSAPILERIEALTGIRADSWKEKT